MQITTGRQRNAFLSVCIAFVPVFGLAKPQYGWTATILGDPTALSTLLAAPTASVTAGDKTFSGFGYSAIGDMPAAAAISVFPIRDDDGDFGLRFAGMFTDQRGGLGSDASIRYAVATSDPRFVQTGAKLFGDPSAGPQSFTVVNQSFPGSSTLLELFATGLGISPPPPKTDDAADFSGRSSSFTTITDLLNSATANGGSASTTFFDQTYTRLLLGDYDHDVDVDGNDFLVWQRELGTSGSAINADGSGNGSVDASDLAVWRGNFGAAAALGAATSETTRIPEPMSGLLLVVASTALHRRCRTPW